MNTILDLFRESYAFKVILGIVTFLVTYQLNDSFPKDTNEVNEFQTEVSFENKFFQAEAFDYVDL